MSAIQDLFMRNIFCELNLRCSSVMGGVVGAVFFNAMEWWWMRTSSRPVDVDFKAADG